MTWVAASVASALLSGVAVALVILAHPVLATLALALAVLLLVFALSASHSASHREPRP